jgi:ribosome-binding factor A
MRKKSHSKPGHRDARGPSQRQLRAGELVRRALAEIVARGDFQDPELVGRVITVSEVRVSPDLRHATCFVAPLGGGDAAALAAALTRVKPYLRGQLAHEVTFKFMPDLSFEPDVSFDKAEAVERLLHSPAVARDLRPDGADEDDTDEDDADEDGED